MTRVASLFNIIKYSLLSLWLVILSTNTQAQTSNFKWKVSDAQKVSFKNYTLLKTSESISWNKIPLENKIDQKRNSISTSFTSAKLLLGEKKKLSKSIYFISEPEFTSRNSFQLSGNENLNFKYLDAKAGMPSDNFQDISFDSQNNLWSISDNRIVKLSGNYVQTYGYKQGFPDFSPISVSAQEDKIIIGTEGQGIFVLKDDSLCVFSDNELDISINHIVAVETVGDSVFLLSKTGHLFLFNLNDREIQSVNYSNSKGRFKSISITNNRLTAVSTLNEILTFKPSGKVEIHKFNSPLSFLDAFAVKSGLYAWTPANQLVYFSGSNWEIISSPYLDNIKTAYPGTSNMLWVFTEKHILLVSKGKIIAKFQNGSHISGMDIMGVIQDKMSNLWIYSSNKGLGLTTPSFISQVELPNGSIEKNSSFLFIDSEGTLYLEKANGGLVKRDREGNLSTLDSPKLKRINAAAELNKSIFFTTENGLFQLVGKQLVSINSEYNQLPLNLLTNISAINQELYINSSKGLLILDGNKLKQVNNITNKTVDIYGASNGSIWIANDETGLSFIKNDSIYFLKILGSIDLNRVYAVSGNGKGAIVFGTNKGLYLLLKDSIKDIMPNFLGINEFKNVTYNQLTKEFWISNNKDIFISKVSDSVTFDFQMFSRNDFVSNGQIHFNNFQFFNRSSYFKVGETVSNYQWYNFSFLDKSPKINLIEVKIESKSDTRKFHSYSSIINSPDKDSIANKLSLPNGNYNFSFLYDLNLWGNEDKLEFYYRIKGISNEWIGPTQKRSFQVNNISTGDYIFEVKTRLSDKIQIEPLAFHFSVKNSFSESILFALLLILTSGVVIYFLIRKFSNLSFDSIDSYTSYSALIKKMRMLSILGGVLIPLVAFYESEALELYEASWPLVGFIVVSAIITLTISFYRKITTQLISIVIGTFFVIVIATIYLIAFIRDLNLVLVVEAAVLLLFSSAVFQRIKHKFTFYLFITSYLTVLYFIFTPEGYNVNVLISTMALSILVTIALSLVNGSSVNNLSFANRILKNSDLLVLVSDTSGKIVYVSNPLKQLTDKTEEELLGLGWWNYRFSGNVDRDRIKDRINDTLKKGSSKGYFNQLNTQQGILDIEWTDYSLEDKFVMSIGKNVTEELKNRREIEMLSLVATSVTNGVSIMDPNNELIWNNNQFRELLGVTEKDIIGKDVIKMLAIKDAESGEVIESMSQIEPNISQTVSFKNHLGDDRFIMLTNSVVNHSNGDVRKRILVWTDVSVQWKIERRYKKIINNAFDTIYTTSPDGKFTYVNKQMETILKLPNNQIVGKHFLELIDDSCKQEAALFYKKQFDLREPYSYFEFKIATKDGSDLWVGQNVRLILDDNNKRIVELHAVARDITESKKIREELKRLSYVARNTGNIVIILDAQFNIEWVNDAFVSVFGYNLEEVFGKNPGDVLNGENTDKDVLDNAAIKLHNHEHVKFEVINYDKFGNEKWIEISMDPIFNDNNEVVNYISVESNITERKSQELLIEEQHRSIIDSLNYGSIIQSATLPSKKEINKINSDVSIYFNPKDIIGGDFYLVETILNSNGNLIEIYIVADCTGHGVPGAMLSVLCSSILKESIRNPKVQNPADALNYTRDQLTETFRANEEYSIYDGMELGLCAVNRTEKTLDYAGANRPLLIYRKEKAEIEVIKGDKQSVGHNYSIEKFTYSSHNYTPGDVMYLFTDGIIDQFGGPNSKKYMSSRFKKFILNTSNLPVEQQVDYFKEEFLSWQGDTEQTDDVCLMSVKLQ